MKKLLVWVLGSLLMLGGSACDQATDGVDGGNDATDSDSATETESDSTTETESDSATETESDSTTETESDSATETESELDTGAFIAVGTDYVSGNLMVIDPVAGTHSVLPVSVGTDAVVRCGDAEAFVLDRHFATPVNELIHLAGADLAEAGRVDLGNLVNPENAVRAGQRIFVSGYGSGHLYGVTPGAPYTVDVDLDLAPYAALAEDDGNPDPNALAVVGDRLYVALAHELAFGATAFATLAVADFASGTVDDQDTATPGPQGWAIAGASRIWDQRLLGVGDELWFAAAGATSWAGGFADGGLFAVDTLTGSSRALVDEATLGGNILSWVRVADGRLFVVVNAPADDPAPAEDRLVLVDLTTAPISVELLGTTAGDGAWHVASSPDGATILWSDRAFGAEALRRFAASDGQELEPIDLPLPAYSMCAVGG